MVSGGCYCGAVRYEVSGNNGGSILCHCYDCRKITGSAYSTNAVYPADGFKVTQGTPKQHTSKGESGREITSNFCGNCGSTMWREGPAFPGKLVIKAGTLDDTKMLDDLQMNAELFVSRRPKWVAPQEGAVQKPAM